MDAITYLTEEVLLSVENDILPLTGGGTVGMLGGFFAGPLAFFAVVSKLGYLLTGQAETSGMHTFMVEYFGRHNDKYRYLSGILIGMYRHALTHEWQPRDVVIANGALLRWRTIRRKPRSLHLLRRALNTSH